MEPVEFSRRGVPKRALARFLSRAWPALLSLVTVFAAPILIGAVLIAVGLLLTPKHDNRPPDWAETHRAFASGEDLAAEYGCLAMDTEGLKLSDSSFSAAFDTPEDLNAGNWTSLDLYYQIRLKRFGNHRYEAVYLTVYPGESDTAGSFPMEGQPVETMELEGTVVRYQQEQGYGARALFVSGGCTYELGVSSHTDPDALSKYLQRLIR